MSKKSMPACPRGRRARGPEASAYRSSVGSRYEAGTQQDWSREGGRPAGCDFQAPAPCGGTVPAPVRSVAVRRGV